MRKREPTKRELMRFVMTPRQRSRMELTVDFDRPVSVLVARETVRKLLDHMEVVVRGYEPPEEIGDVTLRCAEFRRVVRVRVDTSRS